MALHDGINDEHDVRAVVEGGEVERIDARLFAVEQIGIKVRHHVLERIRPAFDMPTGEVDRSGGFRVQQSRIVRQHLIRFITMTDPQLLRRFLIPRQRLFTAIHFKRQAIFPASAALAFLPAPCIA